MHNGEHVCEVLKCGHRNGSAACTRESSYHNYKITRRRQLQDDLHTLIPALKKITYTPISADSALYLAATSPLSLSETLLFFLPESSHGVSSSSIPPIAFQIPHFLKECTTMLSGIVLHTSRIHVEARIPFSRAS